MSVSNDSSFFKDRDWYKSLDYNDIYTKQHIDTLSTDLTDLKGKQHFEVRTDDFGNKELAIVENKSLWSKVKYFFQKDRKNEQVKLLISETVVNLVKILPQEMEDEDIKCTQDFFFNRLAKLSNDVFDRSILGDKQINKKILPEILSPELAKTRKDDTLTPEQDTERKLERRIEKTRLAKKLGIPLKTISQGASGSYFARDHKMKIIGVFKPGREESGGVNTPKTMVRIKNLFVKNVLGIDLQGSFWPSSGYIAEAMTSKLAEHLDIDVVPRSKVTSLMSDQFLSAQIRKRETKETGSYQIFAPETKSADETFHLDSEKSKFANMFLKLNVWRYKDEITKKIAQKDFEKMALVDGLIANRDRHFENWLVETEGKKDGTHRIALIDHQLAFPKVNPPKNDRFYRRNQNKWAVLPQAKEAFSPEIKDKVNTLLKGENLQALLDQLQVAGAPAKGKKVKKFQDIEENEDRIISQEFAFKQRVVVLLVALALPEAEDKKKFSIRDYAGLKSMEEMEAFVNDNIDMPDFDLQDPAFVDAYLGLEKKGS